MSIAVEQLKEHTSLKPTLQLVDYTQGGDDGKWIKWRDTVIGASDGLRAMRMSKALFDIYTGAVARKPFSGNAATKQGHAREADARWNYELEHRVTLAQLCGQRGFIASSSDGTNILSNPDKRMAIEVKSPTDQAIHDKYIGGKIGDIGDTHYHQCQQTIYVYDLDYIEFISFKPDAAENVLKEFTLRVWPNDEYINDMVYKLSIFWDRVQSNVWPDAEKTSLALAKSIAGPSAPAMVATGVPYALSQRVGDLVSSSIMQVNSQQSSEDATDLIKSMRNINTKLNSTRLEITKPHRDYCTDVKYKFDSVSDELTKASKSLTDRLHAYNEEQERIRQEEIKRQQEEIRLQQEEEQRKLHEAQMAREAEERKIREAEQLRIQKEANAARAIEDARLATERAKFEQLNAEAAAVQAKEDERISIERAARAKKNEEERLRLEQQANEEAAKRNEEERLRLEQQANDDAARLEQQSKKQLKTRGMASTASTRSQMNFEVEDLSKVPAEYLILDEVKIRKEIRRKDSPVREIDGLKIFETKTTVVR